MKAYKIIDHEYDVVVLGAGGSGLRAAVGAAGVNPGDQVITTPWTMCATATSILHWNAIPVFVDICKKDFNLSLTDVQSCVKEHDIKAIMIIHTYGNPVDLDFLVDFFSEDELFFLFLADFN